MKACAICGKSLAFFRGDLCKEHFNEYKPRKSFPLWLKELIKIERHNDYIERNEPILEDIEEVLSSHY